MDALLITIFVIAYAAIAFEHPLKVNKSAPALIGAGLLWTIYAVSAGHVTEQVVHAFQFGEDCPQVEPFLWHRYVSYLL